MLQTTRTAQLSGLSTGRPIDDGSSRKAMGTAKPRNAQMQASMNTSAWTKRLRGRLTRKSAMQSLLLTFLSWFAGPTACAAHMQNASFMTSDGLAVTQSQKVSGIHVAPSAVSKDRVNPQHGKVHECCFTGAAHFRITASPGRRKR